MQFKFYSQEPMLRRNKFPPLPDRPEHLSPRLQPATSPNAPLARLERRREDSAAKSGSLNAKLHRRNPQGQQPKQEECVERVEPAVNSDYFPEGRERGKSRGRGETLVESAPVLPEWERAKREEEMSTELSKHSECPELPREVRFGGVIEGRAEPPTRDKIRSPSILKNGRTILNRSLLTSKERERSCSVASGRNPPQKQEADNNTNKIIKQKYRSIVARLQTDAQATPRANRFSAATYQTEPRQSLPSPLKYRDEIFPPVASSVFAAKKGRERLGEEISWMRLPELFAGRTLALVGKERVQIVLSPESYAQEYLAGAMNCLAGSNRLLERIFEGQAVSPFGIYLLRIYQETTWKYIIIDDYVPVVRTASGVRPAFLSVRLPEHGAVDIWPFLLEKAYANYYSRYEALQLGSLVEFAEELAGTPSRRIQLKSEGTRKRDRMSEEETAKALLQARRELQAGEVLAIGELQGEGNLVPLLCCSDGLSYLDPADSFLPRQLPYQRLPELFRAVHVISPFRFSCCSSSVIRRTRSTTGVQIEQQWPSVRVLRVQSGGEVGVSLRQREKRLFHLKEQFGEYIWCRFLLLQREGAHGFRWIAGEYAQRKALSFIHFLEPGEYWLLVEPEWRPNSPPDLTLLLYAAAELPLERVAYRPEQRVIESACLDLAQRFGQLNQINKYICSYNFVSERVGLIIENIVNERVSGEVTVMRSIRGLKCKVQILPVNPEFYEEEGGRRRLREEIELDIPKGENFTVVLKLKGGIDRKFFKSFDFGC